MRVNCYVIRTIGTMVELTMVSVDPIRVSSKCPTFILPDRRTDRVIGHF